jgi:hypothetical protein
MDEFVAATGYNRKYGTHLLANWGESLTKPGSLLKNKIPVRTFFTWDERKPGFFELDTVSHCRANAAGES